jgi:hypothetical protein
MAKWWWASGGAMVGAFLAWTAAIFWMYLERSDFGAREPVYHGYWAIAAFGALIIVSPPGAVVGGIVGYLVGRRLGRSGTASSEGDASKVRGSSSGLL